jgi:hypothetical protein
MMGEYAKAMLREHANMAKSEETEIRPSWPSRPLLKPNHPSSLDTMSRAQNEGKRKGQGKAQALTDAAMMSALSTDGKYRILWKKSKVREWAQHAATLKGG